MKISTSTLINSFLILLLALLLAGFQTAIWDHLFGAFPAPHFWMPCLIYCCLYRSTAESVIMVYLLSTILSAYTILPIGLLILINLGVAAAVSGVKKRLYVAGTNYFMLMCGLGALLFTAVHLSLSWTVEDRPVVRPEVFFWVVRILLTALVAWPIYPLLRWIDRLTEKEIPAESGQVFE